MNFILTDLSPPSQRSLDFLILEFVEGNVVSGNEDDGVERKIFVSC